MATFEGYKTSRLKQVVESEMTLDRGAARSFKAFKAISLQGFLTKMMMFVAYD